MAPSNAPKRRSLYLIVMERSTEVSPQLFGFLLIPRFFMSQIKNFLRMKCFYCSFSTNCQIFRALGLIVKNLEINVLGPLKANEQTQISQNFEICGCIH